MSRANWNSVHGNVRPLHQAPTPVSPAQTHHDPEVQEQGSPAHVEDPDDESETQPSLSSVSTSSNPASLGQKRNPRSDLIRRTTHWKTIGTILGFNFAAFLSALGHYFLFRKLDYQLTETSYLTQPQVSAVLILLTTIFKATLTATIGTSFTQHLWLVLRGNLLPIDTIEKMFMLRTNIFRLFDVRSTWRSPTLIVMALSVWCLGLATVYPPGALIVAIDPYTFTEELDIAVMNPPIPRDLDFAGNESFPSLTSHGFDDFYNSYGNPEFPLNYTRILEYHEPNLATCTIAQSIIMDNRVFSLPGHLSENSSYKLQFRGPQLRCNTSRYGNSIPLNLEQGWLSGAVFVSKWLTDLLSLVVLQHDISSASISNSDQNTTFYTAHVETTEQTCNAKSVLYDVNVTFPRGVQKLEYHLSDEEDMRKKWNDASEHIEGRLGSSRLSLAIPADPQVAQDWNTKVLDALPAFNEWAILDALGILLDGVGYERSTYSYCSPIAVRDNKTTTKECGAWESDMYGTEDSSSSEAPLRGTVFQTARFDPASPNTYYDARKELNITETLLNDVLTKITLSAISLGLWQETIPVNITRYQSTYSFANPLNLILPYSICFVAASVFAGVATYSLSRNGTPAADGGFLQIMTATRGDTEMERLVLRHHLTKLDKLPMELRSLKVRYCELIGADVPGFEGRFGFGTAEETMSLRRRK